MARKKKEDPILFDAKDYKDLIVTSDDFEKEVVEDSKLSNDNIIKNISYDQSEILYNIGQLFYNGRGGGKYVIPEPKILMDVFPQREDIKQIERWGPLPLEDGSIHSLVIDLPFVISPANAPSAKSQKKDANLIYHRFSAYYPVDNLYLSYYHWLREAYRVLDEGGICIFKCQSCISGGIRHNIEEFSFMAAQKFGFKMIDKFNLLAKARL